MLSQKAFALTESRDLNRARLITDYSLSRGPLRPLGTSPNRSSIISQGMRPCQCKKSVQHGFYGGKARPRRPPRACGQRSRCRSCPGAPAAGRSHNTMGARRAGNFRSRRSRGKTALLHAAQALLVVQIRKAPAEVGLSDLRAVDIDTEHPFRVGHGALVGERGIVIPVAEDNAPPRGAFRCR